MDPGTTPSCLLWTRFSKDVISIHIPPPPVWLQKLQSSKLKTLAGCLTFTDSHPKKLEIIPEDFGKKIFQLDHKILLLTWSAGISSPRETGDHHQYTFLVEKGALTRARYMLLKDRAALISEETQLEYACMRCHFSTGRSPSQKQMRSPDFTHRTNLYQIRSNALHAQPSIWKRRGGRLNEDQPHATPTAHVTVSHCLF